MRTTEEELPEKEKDKPTKTERAEMSSAPKAKKLSFKERREFELLEKEISQLEKEKRLVTDKLNSGTIPYEELQLLSKRIGEITSKLDEKELRWLELSE
jgi:ATP-binding cassette subfamily F protein uup